MSKFFCYHVVKEKENKRETSTITRTVNVMMMIKRHVILKSLDRKN